MQFCPQLHRRWLQPVEKLQKLFYPLLNFSLMIFCVKFRVLSDILFKKHVTNEFCLLTFRTVLSGPSPSILFSWISLRRLTWLLRLTERWTLSRLQLGKLFSSVTHLRTDTSESGDLKLNKCWSKRKNDRRNSGGTLRQKFNLNDI